MNNIEKEAEQARRRYAIVGHDPALRADIERAVRVAPTDLSVLIGGESGTGKEFFPRIIHDFSARKHAPYIAVNCGAIPQGTIDSELFGHEKGAFTGAVGSRKGYFEEAKGGTIFLDEVAELPMTTQARLLRVLETGEFLKVGSSTVERTDVRIVAATNVDLQKAIAQGRFREDLYYRLSTVQINVPPLRDRGNDIYLLARLFASNFAERYKLPAVTFDSSAKDVMLSYRWPGNERQLKNIVEQLSLFEAGNDVDGATFASYLPKDSGSVFTPAPYDLSEGSRYEREREMLMGMLLSLQAELKELKEKMARQGGEFPPSPILMGAGTQPKGRPMAEMAHDIEDVTPADDDSFRRELPVVASRPETLQQTELETIRKALERNGGARKATAAELGISERTLYRKIKEFGLE